MKTVHVTYAAGASATTTVTVPDDASLDDIDQAACGDVSFTLCHQCGREMDIGDPDLEMITSEDYDTVIYDRSAEERTLARTGGLAEVRERLADAQSAANGAPAGASQRGQLAGLERALAIVDEMLRNVLEART